VFAAVALGWSPALADDDLRLEDAAARRQAQAQLEQLNDSLLHHHSATAVLQQWCDTHGPRPAPRIVARRVPGAQKPADAAVRVSLKAGASEPIRYRRVQLACGAQVLSEADNWYRPGRLSAEMNRLLDETETPFGVAVAPLGFTRGARTTRLLFQPARGRGPMAAPREVLRQSAVLATPDGAPFSLVVETYTREVLRPRAREAP
jgi:chorismate-pyruvate lyase